VIHVSQTDRKAGFLLYGDDLTDFLQGATERFFHKNRISSAEGRDDLGSVVFCAGGDRDDIQSGYGKEILEGVARDRVIFGRRFGKVAGIPIMECGNLE
jgi:hypothetical protein